MSKSLAELRATKPQSRPERSITLCLAPHLVAEVQALTDEMATLPIPRVDGDEPKRMGEGEPERAVQIRERLQELLAEMAEHEGELRLRANRTDGEWRRWCNEHPARGDDEPGHDRDQRVAAGFCNADDLLDDLAAYAHTWNGEPLTGSDFGDIFEPNIATADKAQIAQAVVAMYESRLDFPHWRNGLSASLQRLNDFASPELSESPMPASTGGSRGRSSAATTKKATKSA